MKVRNHPACPVLNTQKEGGDHMTDNDLKQAMVQDAEQYLENLVRETNDVDMVLVELVKAHRLQTRMSETDYLSK